MMFKLLYELDIWFLWNLNLNYISIFMKIEDFKKEKLEFNCIIFGYWYMYFITEILIINTRNDCY